MNLVDRIILRAIAIGIWIWIVTIFLAGHHLGC